MMKTNRTLRALRCVVLLLAMSLSTPSSPLIAQTEDEKFPSWSDIESAVNQQLHEITDYEEKDLVAREEVEPLWKTFDALGWKVDRKSQKSIEDQLLPKSDFLVKQLRSSKSARTFMRQVAEMPGGYDRIDHLRQMKYGERRIQELIRGPDGYKLIEYMTESTGGKNFGKQLSNAPGGKDFNKPTGRIYTEKSLLERLKVPYDKAAELHAKAVKLRAASPADPDGMPTSPVDNIENETDTNIGQ
ncbi:MAG: hypothetical protein ACKVT0_22645 [Planctomycetaceae bacterium]